MSTEALRRNTVVREALRKLSIPIGPTELGRIIGESWCCYPHGNGNSAAVVPVLRRIGAVGINGKYSLK